MDRITINLILFHFIVLSFFRYPYFYSFAYHFVSDMTLINLVFDKIYIVHNKLLDLFLTFKYYQIFISPKSAVEFSIFVLLIVLIYIFFCYKN